MADILLPYTSTVADTLLSIASLVALVAWIAAYRGVSRSLDSLLPVNRGVEEASSCRIAVVIPARNSGGTIDAVLDSVAGIPGLERAVVVDDASVDDTPWIVLSRALSDWRIRYVRVERIPPGWFPKPYLLYRGVAELEDIRVDVILFLDSDTRVRDPAALAATLCSYARHGRVITGLMPSFTCANSYCEAAETLLNTLALGYYGFHRVHDPGDELAWFYGCCWATNPSTYSQVPHSLVRRALVEDHALAEIAKRMGILVRIHDGRGLVETEGYTRAEQTRNLIARLALEKYSGSRARGVAETIVAAVVLLLPPLWPLMLLAGTVPAALLAITAWGVELAVLARTARIHGYNTIRAILLSPIAAVHVLQGLVDAIRGRTRWAGRIYYAEDGTLFFDEAL